MGDVVRFNGATSLDIDPEAVLDGAKEMGLDSVLVIGWSGNQFYLASSTGDVGELLIKIRLAERDILESMN